MASRDEPAFDTRATPGAGGPPQRRQILRDMTATFTRRGAGVDDGLQVAQRQEVLRDATATFTLHGAGFDDGIDIELLPEIPREPTPASTRPGAGVDDGVGVARRREILRDATATFTLRGTGFDDGIDIEQRREILDTTPAFTRPGAESDDWGDDESWFDPKSWLRAQYECREAVPISVAEYVAMIWIAIRPAERIAGKYMNWLIEDSGKHQFAWSALYLIVEWHRDRAMELPRNLEAWYRPIRGRIADTGHAGQPTAGRERNFLRNLAICDAVDTAHHYLRVPVSRNREPSPTSPTGETPGNPAAPVPDPRPSTSSSPSSPTCLRGNLQRRRGAGLRVAAANSNSVPCRQSTISKRRRASTGQVPCAATTRLP